jgi:hypothetical protein
MPNYRKRDPNGESAQVYKDIGQAIKRKSVDHAHNSTATDDGVVWSENLDSIDHAPGEELYELLLVCFSPGDKLRVWLGSFLAQEVALGLRARKLSYEFSRHDGPRVESGSGHEQKSESTVWRTKVRPEEPFRVISPMIDAAIPAGSYGRDSLSMSASSWALLSMNPPRFRVNPCFNVTTPPSSTRHHSLPLHG